MTSTKERLDEIATINFSITKCPMKVYKDFVAFCKEETNDNYSFGIKMLVDGMKGNAKEAVLFEQYMELKQRMDELENNVLKMNNTTEEVEKKKLPKTMGSGGKER